MKGTIGIVGGCGPLATLDFEKKILKANQEILFPLLDQHYVNLLVYNRTQFSDRNDTIIFDKKSLAKEYINVINSLNVFEIDLLIITCQTAHLFLEEIKSNTNISILSIIKETTNYITSLTNISKVGLISTEATKKSKIYTNALFPHSIEVIELPDSLQKKIMEAIYIIKSGIELKAELNFIPNKFYSQKNLRNINEIKKHPYKKILLNKFLPNPIKVIEEATKYFIDQKCNNVIMGCTELPLALPYINKKVNYIDPNQIISEVAIKLIANLNKNK